jgi:hypothetical protein
MNSFTTIAAVSGHQAGSDAKTVANVDVYINISDEVAATSYIGRLVLQRFGTTSLFRIVGLSNTSPFRNKMVLCLPTASAWRLSQLRKIKSKNSGMKAIQFDILTLVGDKEGFDKLVITIPFDGNDGSAMLYYQAVVFANQEVHCHL